MDCGLPGSSVHGTFPGRNTGVKGHSLLQGVFLTQGSNPGLLHCGWILYRLSHQGSPLKHCVTLKWASVILPWPNSKVKVTLQRNLPLPLPCPAVPGGDRACCSQDHLCAVQAWIPRHCGVLSSTFRLIFFSKMFASLTSYDFHQDQNPFEGKSPFFLKDGNNLLVVGGSLWPNGKLEKQQQLHASTLDDWAARKVLPLVPHDKGSPARAAANVFRGSHLLDCFNFNIIFPSFSFHFFLFLLQGECVKKNY